MLRWPCVLLLSICQQVSCLSINATAETVSSNVVISDLSKLRFIGRWYDVGGGKAHAWRASFEVRFRRSTTVAVNLASSYGLRLYYVCFIDGQPPVRRGHQEGQLQIASDLDAAVEHTVICGRSNEGSYGETILKSVALDSGGEVLQAPQTDAAELKLEVIGDSITAGFATKWQPGQPTGATVENSDVYDTYARYVADGLGTSDWSVVARSGIPVYPYSATEPAMARQWVCRNYFWAPASCEKEWDFSTWRADVVIINLGTNDYVYGSMTDQQFVDAYKALILLVKGKYPDALIQCLIPLAYSCHSAWVPKWRTMKNNIESAVEQLADNRVKVYATGTTSSPWLDCQADYSGDQTHPNIAGNQKFANKLLDVLTPDIRAAFPSKCSGTGAGCASGSAVPLPRPAPAPVPATTTGAATTSTAAGATGTAAPVSTSSQCCYAGGCASLGSSDCNEAGTWCSQTADQCSTCGGTFCEASGSRGPTPVPAPPAPLPAATPVSPQGSQCCYSGSCDGSASPVCNEVGAWCSLSAENCGSCGGSLCFSESRVPSSTPTSTTATTQTTTAASACQPVGDCGSAGWCNQEAYESWCASQSGLCPSPFCMSNHQASLQAVTAHASVKGGSKKKENKFLDAVLLQVHNKIQRGHHQHRKGAEEL